MTRLQVEVVGDSPLPADELTMLVAAAAERAGVSEGHAAVAFVSAAEIARLNGQYRGKDGPTDVLSFPVDEAGSAAGPRELGDIVICPEHTEDLREAVVHGALHLVGFDHEVDDGEMLAVQAEVLAATRGRHSVPDAYQRPPT